MEIPWKNLMPNTGPLLRNAQSCIKTSSPVSRQWCGESLPCLFGNPALMVWPPHTYCIWPCQAHQKYSCTVRGIGSLRNLPPQMKNHGLNEEKLYRRKITLYWVKWSVWLVWILTTKRKSLKRVETCHKNHFTFRLFCYVNSFFRFNHPNGFYSLDIYIYPFNLFCMEPLIVLS